MSNRSTSGYSGTAITPNPPPRRLGPNHDEFLLPPKRLPLEHPHPQTGFSCTPTAPNLMAPAISSSRPLSASTSSPSCPQPALAPRRDTRVSPVSIITPSLEVDDDEAFDEESEAEFENKIASRGQRRLKRLRDAHSDGDAANTKIPRLAEPTSPQHDDGESSQSVVATTHLSPRDLTVRHGSIEPADPATLAASDTLEVDEGFCDENGEEYVWRNSSTELIRQSSTNGYRQLGPLRYRASGQYTSRIQPVVRSRPRMRKRKDLPTLPTLAPANEGPN
ncbi:hypothetical protein BN1723_009381 [Verticillium longisporum]|uniref:Uncharacterized protein n=1 Tax=Verticillium longisporum TaxID=100787 RepID=A0A0G4KPY2_VERLO|nr:hypothetical protein BN1723_009381 [Verticillium longisporum]CRK26786.1 hypothetical protein BN1708_000597 [Verticillium longisporum]